MHTQNNRLLWQHLTTMVIDKRRKMTVKDVKLKSESFLISLGVLELWRKNLRGVGGFRPPPPPPALIGLKISLHRPIMY